MVAKKFILDNREREILSKLSDHFEPNPRHEADLNSQNIENLLSKAWNEEPIALHEMGIPKYKIAQMFKKLFSKNEFLVEYNFFQKRGDFFYWQVSY